MFVPKDRYMCWISSIVQLPNFYPPGSKILGEMYGETGEEYYPISRMKIWQGRNLVIPGNLFKYKVEIRCNDLVYDLVGLSTADGLTMQELYSGNRCNESFFPIYICAYNECLLFINSINDLFHTPWLFNCSTGDANIKGVTSPLGLIKELHYLCDWVQPEDLIARYGVADEHLVFSRINRQFSIPTIVSLALSGDSMDHACKTGTTLRDMITKFTPPKVPDGVYNMHAIRRVFDLTRFVNPYGAMPSDIAMSCMSMMQTKYDEVRRELENGCCFPFYSEEINLYEPEESSLVGRWLTGIFQQPFSDFSFVYSFEEFGTADEFLQRIKTRGDFTKTFERFTERDLMSYLDIAFNLRKCFTDRCLVQRSWLEDIVIRDMITGKIRVYIDMIPWILACAEGLINTTIVDNVCIS